MHRGSLLLLVSLVAAVPASAGAAMRRPTGVTATVDADDVVAIGWVDPNTAETGYAVERRALPRGRFARIAVTPPDATTLADADVVPGGRYRYRVRALGRRPSIPSLVVGVTIPDAPPANRDRPTTTTSTTIASTTTSSTRPVASTTTSTSRPPTTVTTTSSTTSTRAPTTSSTTSSTLPNQAPVASAGPDQMTQTLTAVAFSGAGSHDPDGAIVAWAWTFGDGAQATGASVSHAYAHAGTYTATLTVTDDRGAKGSDTAVVRIANRPPVANAGPDVSGAPGASLAFSGAASSDPDGTIVSWAWTFGDGATATGASVAHAWAAAGTYIVGLTVTDDAGATASDAATVTITAASAGGGTFGWVRAFGGTGFEEARGVGVDASGNVTITGQVTAPVDLGGVVCGNSIMVASYTGAGALRWAKCLGGAGGGSGRALAVDGAGNVLVTGYFRGTVDFGGGPLASPDGYDVFVVKYTAAGAHVWSRRAGSPTVNALPDESGTAIATDAAGNVLVAGYFEGTADFGGGPLTSAGQSDGFVAKYSAAGAHVWSRRFGGLWGDVASALAVDAAGNVVVTGTFLDPVDFGGGPLASTGFDVFLVKYGPTGAHLWSERFGGTLADAGTAVAVDGSGNVFLSGTFQNTIDLGGGPLTSAGGNDVFLAKLTSGGGHVWSRRIGGTSNYDGGTGLAVDAAGNAVLAGYFSRTVDFGGGAVTSGGSKDVFVARYAASGAYLWSRRFGGANIDQATAVALGGGGAYVTGSFFATVDFGAGAETSAGDADLFLLRLAP